jgi:hypothetical protein
VETINIVIGGQGSSVLSVHDGCLLLLPWIDNGFAMIAYARVGENNINTGTWYCLNDAGEFIEDGAAVKPEILIDHIVN